MTLTLPNLLSVCRLGLVPIFIIAVVDGRSLEALIIMGIAGLTDALDGYIARYLHQQSLLGSYLDPVADKLLMTAAYVVLTVPGLTEGITIPVWVTVLVITRDVAILGLALILYLTVGIRRFPPTLTSKLTTVFQVAAILMVLITGIFPVAVPAGWLILVLAAALTVVSGLQYALRLARMSGEVEE